MKNSKNLKVAMCGPSGSGKTTLGSALASHLGIILGYWGSRDTARALGFSNPYDCDAANLAKYHEERAAGASPQEAAAQAMLDFRYSKPGETCRKLFQSCIRSSKLNHEASLGSFVTDRTLLDDAVHAELAGGGRGGRSAAIRGTAESYTVVFHMPSSRFQDVGDDPARLKDPEYHARFEEVLEAMLDRVRNQPSGTEVITLTQPGAFEVFEEALDHLERLCLT